MKKSVVNLSPIYCAFLRGVNVKGTTMKMAEVSAVFGKAGMEAITTVLASGNVLFSSNQPKDVSKTVLETALSQHFDYPAFLFVKDKQQLATIVAKNPFIASPDFHIYIFIGIEGLHHSLMQEFEQLEKTEGEEASVIDENFYWKVPKGNTLDSKFGKILGRKNLRDAFTSRNMNTIEKIFQKM